MLLWDVRLGAHKELTTPSPQVDLAASHIQEIVNGRNANHTRHAAATGGVEHVEQPLLCYDSSNAAHPGQVTCLAWSSDGTKLISGDEHGVVIVWAFDKDNVFVLTSPTQPVATHRWVAHSGSILQIRIGDSVRRDS